LLKISLDNLLLIQAGFGDAIKEMVMNHVSVRLQHIAGVEGKTVTVNSDDKFLLLVRGNGAVSQPLARKVLNALANLRISAIVDACFGVIVDGVSEPSWTRRGCAQARS
jgi:hypothetical protein